MEWIDEGSVMPGHRSPTLSAVAERELENCLREGLNSKKTRLRLARHGVVLSERSICRRLTALRAEQSRIRDLEAIGRGLGSVQIGATGAAEILRASMPDWRRKQAGILRDLFQAFLEHPTGELYSGLAVGLHAFFLGARLSEGLERPDA
jgi:hypothetical protein